MAAYNKCLQICFIIVQLFFIAIGLGLIGVGAWLEVAEQSIVAAVEQQAFLIGPYLLIAAGIAIVLVAFIGVVGACCDGKFNRALLIVYIIVVIVIFLLEITGAVLAFVYREQALGFVQDGLTATIDRYNGTTPTDIAITEAWDFVQATVVCCGVNNSTDWLLSPSNLTIPDTCCNVAATCVADQYINGCSNALLDLIRSQLVIVAAIGIAFVVGEIIVVLMAFCLLCCTDFDKE